MYYKRSSLVPKGQMFKKLINNFKNQKYFFKTKIEIKKYEIRKTKIKLSNIPDVYLIQKITMDNFITLNFNF